MIFGEHLTTNIGDGFQDVGAGLPREKAGMIFLCVFSRGTPAPTLGNWSLSEFYIIPNALSVSSECSSAVEQLLQSIGSSNAGDDLLRP
jgi:hypothetical protein